MLLHLPSLIALAWFFSLLAGVQALRIVTPNSDETVDVDKLYNLTWTTEGLGPNYKVETIKVETPYFAPLRSISSYYYLQGYGSDTNFNISANKGYTLLNLTNWWSPVYNDLPRGTWTISIDVSDEWTTSTRQNDTVQVHLTSGKAYQRPILPPLKSFNPTPLGDNSNRPSSSSGIWPVVVSVVVPFIVFVGLGCLARIHWTYHKYTSIARSSNVQQLGAPSLQAAKSPQAEVSDAGFNTTKGKRLPRLFILAAFVALGPLVGLLIALISLLLQYKVEASPILRPDFWYNHSSPEPSAFYIKYDATRYTTVASWTSSIALLLPGFLTTMIWYRQSQILAHESADARYQSLPTPYQLSLLLNLKSGTLGSLWEYLQYICSRGREKQARFLFDAGFVVLMSTVLGVGIWSADTWLHVTTTTVSFSEAAGDDLAYFSYGRRLWNNCSSEYLATVGQTWSCAVTTAGIADIPVLADSFSYASLITDRHDTTSIKYITLGEDRIAYVGPARDDLDLDYRANTVAVRSKCDNIDRWCTEPTRDTPSGVAFPAHCGKFVGSNYTRLDAVSNSTTIYPGVVEVVTTYFKDQDWQTLQTFRNASNSIFTVSRLVSAVRPTFYGLPTYWSASSETGAQWASYIGCHTEFLNFTYTYVNGSIRAADLTPLANYDVANTIIMPAMMGWDPFLTSGAATVMTSKSVQSALRSWVDTIHLHYLPFAAMVMDEVDNIAEQTRYPMLVARIPKAPLFTLIMLLALSIVFNLLVLVASLWKTNLVQAHGKQLIVTVAGLAAFTFDRAATDTKAEVDSAWNLFTESNEHTPSTRVGIDETEAGGYHFFGFREQGYGKDKFSHGLDQEANVEEDKLEQAKVHIRVLE